MLDFATGMDFETADGRALIRATLAPHADVLAALAAWGPPTKAERTAAKANRFGETLEEYVLTDRYWHGLHRVAPAAPEAAG